MQKSLSISTTGSFVEITASNSRIDTSQSVLHRDVCSESLSSSGAIADGLSGTNVKFEEELRKAQNELKAKDHEIEELKSIKLQLESEVQDLTVSLYMEANKMVGEAKSKEMSSDKKLQEVQMELDGFKMHIEALKSHSLNNTTSTLSSSSSRFFNKQRKRAPLQNNGEFDPQFYRLFSDWRNDPTLIKDEAPFLQKIYLEDIEPCLSFPNEELTKRLWISVTGEENSICIEPIQKKEKSRVPKDCVLMGVPRICNYRMRFSLDSVESFEISQLCRDRIAAVCEILNYLRYIKNGLVKASMNEAYWEIIRLRKQMSLAKLGLSQ